MNIMSDVRVRFCPSPTGTPHVGMVRTALFNWAHARHTGGKLIFRIEDTDAARDSEESYQAIIDSLKWLGMDWDEGVIVGGPHEPYRQSQRMDIYKDVLEKLKEAGFVYPAYSTAQEVEERHKAAGRDPKLGYDNYDRTLTDEQIAAFEAEGRQPVWRLRMPERDWKWNDLVRGEIEFKSSTQPDYVVARSNGAPLYTLVNPVDDALMGITHVLRGEDLLPSTPRQLALYEALKVIGVAQQTPEFGHLPFVMGEGNKKLSKRDPQSNLFNHRDAGIIPEGMLNYLALLGWSLAGEKDIFSVDELVENFDVTNVLANPARFDQKKLEAINADHIRLLEPKDFEQRLRAYLTEYTDFPTDYPAEKFAIAAELVQTRIKMLGDAYGLLSFLAIADEDLTLDEKSAKKNLKETAIPALDAGIAALEGVEEWTTPAIEAALHKALIEDLDLKPRVAFGALRVGISGQAVSPPLFESMELLGKESTLTRLRATREVTPYQVAAE
ncbi:glutamate--tRNA ligase [Corynebacterium diphtheriae]|uniref:Glutamate--tRNA ligase n=2 Tax=Corynebacterium diphtheriae TaxID=1717 RepID=SYE_CORDI|nr:glutamate--tRNA ligase [Corynebacterium diphtheriae]Q6NHM1.1 RecName: Full=Glutamate--tRNA ligase; AltName: Full=Glutamyl-tRNA synthetase; Short=GluRS [Corynebacterium diphtheriae NCTC 13129]KKA81753.1 glutamyl-tRNA synthetase [Corynebacterium diphtheriae]MBG9227655.1 glutamate--tRNA ligase [Corynebacterium diphtheriae bv. gravis]MBG9248476.1 glutamate--tRNA ligase [Corynebacterium diphtheriae bv. gravis]MBG9249726.1 glutamate--tRNA ligase [Corynebacterium diphtheriae bv. mitis]MBG9254241.